MNVFFSAGEVSGDMIAATIAAELLRRDPATRLWGLGGMQMQSAGVDLLEATTDLGRVGVSESFSAVRPALRAFAAVRRAVRQRKPDVAVLVANDVFNVWTGWWLRKQGVATIAVFPPQVWIWRSLLRFFARGYDVVAASFPEEHRRYAPLARTTFVGHYLADELPRASAGERLAARRELGLEGPGRVIGLLPGSRAHEIRTLLPLLRQCAQRLQQYDPQLRFVLPRSPSGAPLELQDGDSGAVRVVSDSRAVMRAADLLLIASGTATLEAALIGTPMLVLYRVSPLTIGIVRLAIRLGLMDSETIALPNLLTGRSIVPEFSQERLSVGRVTSEAILLLEDEAGLARMRKELATVRDAVAAGGSISRICDLVHPETAAGMGEAAWR